MMTTNYPSNSEGLDTLIELMCDDFPITPVYLEWDDRCKVVCQLLDVIRLDGYVVSRRL
jgi:hypothetical protein